MSSTKSKSKVQPLSDQEIQQNYNRFQGDLQTIARKIGELESESEEHGLVLSTLEETLAEEPDRKCFRLIGGVLVERTVKDVVPALQTNREGIRKAVESLTEQYKTKEKEFDTFKQDYNIRLVSKV
ncbi:prefoldin subunit [Moniliophthora roreri MCA 2997]|uniref:Prefoldin subunit n=2 Tax=Moniliophthora roreri TaxID=221103 RepID=V2YU35_MONRO|nr:prefoldin subunit [Moniliophthora roreri MCA 2997]KAI3616666.1 prefoldin subunit [Moniliophthora roreri]